MKLTLNERQRIASGDVKYLKVILEKELEEIKESLLVYKELRGLDDMLKGQGYILKEIIKVLES